MIYVPPDKTSHMEFIIQSARHGVHLFFDPSEVRESLSDSTPLSLEESYQAEPLLERLLIHTADLQAARAAFGELEPTRRRQIIRTYFALLENQVYSEKGLRH